MALFGPNLEVAKRIGDGVDRCRSLRETWPVRPATAWPIQWPDHAEPGYADFASGELRFVCSAPLYSSDGMTFGLLLIADTQPRPDFKDRERDTFAELAGVFGRKMELRGMATDALAAELAMREAEERFRNIADCAPVLIIYSDSEARCCFVNRTWLEFTGRSFEDETGDGFAQSFHPAFRELVMRTRRDAFAARRPRTIEFPMLRYDGEYRWMHASGQPRFLPDGTFVGYIGCFVDITEQRNARLEAAKYKAVAEAVAAAGGVRWQLLDPCHSAESAAEWTSTPILLDGCLMAVVATNK